MDETYELDEELVVESLLESEEPPLTGDESYVRMTAMARRSLRKVAALYWQRYLEEVELRGLDRVVDGDAQEIIEGFKGAYVRLTRFRLDRAASGTGERLVMDEELGLGWAIRWDQALDDLVATFSRTEDALQWPRPVTCELVGTVVGPAETGETGCSQDLERAIVLEPRAIRVPGQVSAFRHPETGWHVVGLKAAEERLALYRDGTALRGIDEPKDLLRPLFMSLVEDDFDIFKRIWSQNLSDAYKKQRFEQLKRNYHESKGEITFERYLGSSGSDEGSQENRVRMYVRRRTVGGEMGRNILVCVREECQWRFESGTF